MGYIPKRPSTLKKYKRIQKRYDELYNGKRIRHDDCIQKLMDEFFIDHPNTISMILCLDLQDKEVEQYPGTMKMFD